MQDDFRWIDPNDALFLSLFFGGLFASGFLTGCCDATDAEITARIVEERKEPVAPALQLPIAYDFYMRQASPGEEPRHTYYTRPKNR